MSLWVHVTQPLTICRAQFNYPFLLTVFKILLPFPTWEYLLLHLYSHFTLKDKAMLMFSVFSCLFSSLHLSVINCNGLELIKYVCVLFTNYAFKNQSRSLAIISQTCKFYLYQQRLYKKWALLASERQSISEMFQPFLLNFGKEKKNIDGSVNKTIPKLKGKTSWLEGVDIKGFLHSLLRLANSVWIYLFILFCAVFCLDVAKIFYWSLSFI